MTTNTKKYTFFNVTHGRIVDISQLDGVDLNLNAVIGYDIDEEKILHISSIADIDKFEKKYEYLIRELLDIHKIEKEVYNLDLFYSIYILS